MQESASKNGSVLVSEADRARIVALIAQLGEQAVQRALAVSRETLARALAGLGVRRGTALMVSAGLRELERSASGMGAEVDAEEGDRGKEVSAAKP